MAYMGVFQDRNREWLKGEMSYRLRVPPDVPASLFWSAVCYDNRTRTLIDTDQQKATVGKKTEGHRVNEDGSVDVLFGPEWVHILMHMALFAGLAFLLLLVIGKPVDWRVVLMVISAALIVGLLQEGLQIISRSVWGAKVLLLSLYDLGIDVFGAMFGLGMAVAFQKGRCTTYYQAEG